MQLAGDVIVLLEPTCLHTSKGDVDHHVITEVIQFFYLFSVVLMREVGNTLDRLFVGLEHDTDFLVNVPVVSLMAFAA